MYDVVGSNTGDISHIMGKNVTPQNFSFRCEYLLEYIYPSSKFFSKNYLDFILNFLRAIQFLEVFLLALNLLFNLLVA